MEREMKDGIRIDLNDAQAVSHWARDLGVTHEELAGIVRIVGNHADNVREHLLLRVGVSNRGHRPWSDPPPETSATGRLR